VNWWGGGGGGGVEMFSAIPIACNKHVSKQVSKRVSQHNSILPFIVHSVPGKKRTCIALHVKNAASHRLVEEGKKRQGELELKTDNHKKIKRSMEESRLSKYDGLTLLLLP